MEKPTGYPVGYAFVLFAVFQKMADSGYILWGANILPEACDLVDFHHYPCGHHLPYRFGKVILSSFGFSEIG